ncbi:MAG: sulfatase-like hydrolase/transferase, partial [Chthoniobacterales bacterium]|nr:sulfatase-like hydrolase/transferase [Chthoniobacterales bacterium]
QAQWSIGAYGNKDSRTPSMNRIAAEGALFVNSFVNTPVCSPSRASFLTGRNGTDFGITDWITMNESSFGVGLPKGTPTWPALLQANGYATALIGKWHLGNLPEHQPTEHGYEHFYGMPDAGTSPMDPKIQINGKFERVKGPAPDILTNEAMRWIEEHKEKPFALSLHLRELHLAWLPLPEEDTAPFMYLDPQMPQLKFLDQSWMRNRYRNYYGSIHAADRNVGRLLAKLDELKLTDNTIVLFTSDNGFSVGQHGILGKGNGEWVAGGVHGPKRPNMWEESIRVPLLIRWPGVVKPGTRIEQMVSNVDMFASIAGMLGVSLPDDAKHDGRDFSPLMRGEANVPWRSEIFGQYDLHNAGLAFMRMVRTDDWKLLRFHMQFGDNAHYNLKDDPGETKNLYYDPQAREARDALQAKLTAWQQSIDDPLLTLDADRPIEPGPGVGE